jgi:hypothetical protein
VFETNDTPLATFLVYLGFTVSEYRWAGKTCHMVFVDSEALQNAVNTMSKGEALVNPREYHRHMSVLKAEMLSRRGFGTN